MVAATAGDKPTDEWLATLSLDYREKLSSNALKTIAARRRHVGPLTMQRAFYPEQDGICHTYLLHPPAGITGNDRLSIHVDLKDRAKVVVTTPGATRFYRTNGQGASLRQELHIDHETQLEWLPQETLVYARTNATMQSEIRLRGNGQYFGWEVVGLGRPASGEHFIEGCFEFRTQIYRDGRLCIRDRIYSDGMPAGLQNNHAFATLIASGANAGALEVAQKICAANQNLSAPTLIEDFLIVRALANECNPITDLFRQLWQSLRPMLFGRPAAPPQIWRT